MHRYSSTFLSFFMLLTLVGCNAEKAPDCLQKAGDYITTERVYNVPYEKLFIEGRIDLILVNEGTEKKIVITAPENLMPEIITEFVDGELLIRNENTCNWVRDLDLTIQVAVHGLPEIIENAGVGNISSFGVLETDYLEINSRNSSGDVDIEIEADSLRILNHVGTSNITISGIAGKASLFHQGTGVLDASGLLSPQTSVNQSSINSLYAFSSGYLFCVINNTGNVVIGGNPTQIDQDIQGTGELIILN